jgi:predicted transposase YdaD
VNHAKREGREEGKLEIARNMKADREPIEKIMRYTNLTRAEVENLT